MKQILLMIAVVALVGCGKKDSPEPQAEAHATVTPKPEPPKVVPVNIADPIVEKEIRSFFKRIEYGVARGKLSNPTGELTTADLEKVTEMKLGYNKLTEVPKGLESLPRLKELYLQQNQLTSVKGLEKLTKLTWLNIANNQLTNVKGLEKLTQLKRLHLLNNPDLTKAQIDELKKALPKCRISSNPTK